MISFKAGLTVLFLGGLSALVPLHHSSGRIGLKHENSRLHFTSSRLMAGDVVLRKGRGVISEMLSACSMGDKTFSHAGILLGTTGHWQVCHMIGGESSGPVGVVIEPLSEFCNQTISDSSVFIRLTDDTATRRRVLEFCKRKSIEAPPFDFHFDLTDTNSLYCTEFVYAAFKMASNGRVSLPLTTFNGLKYVACDNIYLNEYAQIIH